ncbi:Conserved protein containing a Zn-ribbon-like motif, possibly RNA-binding [Actinoplanes cyaneus]|nr:Conserved protein containing a Zn-ribbon-like motif, possibly RNA-binding [Actinoplanes cyaneus]
MQDLLNSASMPVASVPDLLADQATAQAWLDTSLQTWSQQAGRTPPRITLSDDDLVALRELRSRIRGWLTDEGQDRSALTFEAGVALYDGRLAFELRGSGAAVVISLVLLESLLASHTGALSRLKTCMNPACGAAFYDLSRNSTRVWHDMKTCGNPINLRASRARRRTPPEARRAPKIASGERESTPSIE